MTNVHIGGLDPSTKRCGYAAPCGSLHSIESSKLPAHPTPWDLAKRCNEIKLKLAKTITLNPPHPTLLVIEGGFSHYPGPSARLDELRGVLRDMLYTWPTGAIPFVEIPPAVLKLSATGKGQADKTVMMHAAATRIRLANPDGRVPLNDDEADAWHLRQLGLIGCGLAEPVADYQNDALVASKVAWDALRVGVS